MRCPLHAITHHFSLTCTSRIAHIPPFDCTRSTPPPPCRREQSYRPLRSAAAARTWNVRCTHPHLPSHMPVCPSPPLCVLCRGSLPCVGPSRRQQPEGEQSGSCSGAGGLGISGAAASGICMLATPATLPPYPPLPHLCPCPM